MNNELFEPFTQEKQGARTQYQGTGLGMSIVKELIEKMNGTITVESVLGEGSAFTVTLRLKSTSIPLRRRRRMARRTKRLCTG